MCRRELGWKSFVSRQLKRRCFSSPAALATRRNFARSSPRSRSSERVHTLDPDYGPDPVPSIEAIARRALDVIREQQPTGPYLLGGYSFGGLIALEVAQQLTAGGERVGNLFLIDAVYGERYWSRNVWLRALARRTGWHLSEISRMGPTAAARELGLRSKRSGRPPESPPIVRPPCPSRLGCGPGRPRLLQRAPGTGRDPTRGRSRSSHRPFTTIPAAMPRSSGRGTPIASWWSGSRATTLR